MLSLMSSLRENKITNCMEKMKNKNGINSSEIWWYISRYY